MTCAGTTCRTSPTCPAHVLAEIKHFFEVYKDLEPGKESDVGEWTGYADAIAAIENSKKAFAEQH